jgi:SAM-dependent methyltransferase
MSTTESAPLAAGDPAVRELRAALWAAGYTLPSVTELLGFEGDSVSVPPGQVHIVDRQLPQGDALATLVRLFLLVIPVPAADAEKALGTLSIERCRELGLVTVEDGRVEATCRVLPTRDVIVVCSKQHEYSPSLAGDHVMSVTPSTNLLADLTVRRPVQDALDVCTGGGLQALLCARHARRVVATDLNPRALNYAAFSAQLSGSDNIEFREGDLFDPVGEELFDLVVANPPFIISPDDSYAFRDSPLEGDEISRRTVQGAALHLREGGFAFVLVGWGRAAGQHWSDPLRAWVDGLGCDAWLLHHTSADPFDYAVGFNRPLAPIDPEGYATAVERWVEYDERLGFEAIGYGAIVLRRRTGANWVRADALHRPQTTPVGDLVARLFESQDLLEGLDGSDGLLDLVLRTNEDHRIEQILRKREDGYFVEAARAVLEDGLGFVANIDVNAAQVLVALDGQRTLRSVLDQARQNVHPDVSAEEFHEAALPVVRRMIELGFVLPAH